jgi:hypothetical protein
MRVRLLCSLITLLIVAVSLPAQSTADHPAPAGPRLTFDQRWPAADPQWFQLVIQSDGSARYRSLPHQEQSQSSDPDPFEYSFTLSPRARQLVFSVGRQLPRFQGSLDKLKVAFTGAKTIHYEDGSGASSQITYNYSSASELSAFTDLMQGISSSVELMQVLQNQMRFDKLALDATLRQAEELASMHRLSEPQVLHPILERIATDREVLHIARQRAARILESTSAAAQK